MDSLMTLSCVAQWAAVWLPVELRQLAKVNNDNIHYEQTRTQQLGTTKRDHYNSATAHCI